MNKFFIQKFTKDSLIRSSVYLFFCFFFSFQVSAQCTGAVLNTGTTSITPSASWQTVVMNSGAVRYVTFVATTGNSYVFTCNSTVGGSASGVDEQFSVLTSAGAAAGGVYSKSFVDDYSSGTKERIIWSPSSNGTYRIALSKYSSSSNCQALTANATVGYVTFSGTTNFDFWTGFSSTTFGTGANWFQRATSGYPTESAPTSSYDVTIPSGSSNQPNCADVSADVGSLTINSGATLSMVYNTNSLGIYGNITNNGTINHSGSIYIYLNGTSNTFGGTGNFFAGVASPFNIAAGASYTLQNSVSVRHFYIESTGTFDMNGYDLTTEFFFQVGLLYLRAGNLNIWGGSDASMWYNPGDNLNPYFSTDGNFVTGTGTVFYCQGNTYTTNNQLVRTTTYYNLKVRTQSGYTTTIGTSAATTVSNNFTIENTSTAGGAATTAYGITCNGSINIGTSGNALKFNIGHRIARTTASGTTSFTMGNNTAHIINVTYAHATNWAISLGTSAATNNLTFYGTVNYNSGSAQKVMATNYYNLTVLGAGSRSLSAATVVSNNLTISAGTLTAGTAYDLSVGATWSNSATYTHTNGTVYMNGSANQSIAGSSTTTFYNLTNSNSSTGITLNKGIVVTNNLSMSGATANILLNGYNIDLSSTGTIVGESNTDRIYGTSGVITTTRSLSNISALDVAGMGIVLTTAANMGSTTIQRGHSARSGTGLTNTTILRYFNISPTTNSGLNATFKFTYFDNELNGLGSSEANFHMFRSTDGGSTWTDRNGSESTSGNYISLSAIDAFSVWTVSPNVIIALPVSLISFNGKNESVKGNLLYWETASEHNNSYYTIEKSSDGIEFTVVGDKEAIGNSNQSLYYDLTDTDVRPIINYYRLKQTDVDGNFTYSNVISIDNRIMDKHVKQIVNLYGQIVDEHYKGVVIIVYSDNSILKTYQGL